MALPEPDEPPKPRLRLIPKGMVALFVLLGLLLLLRQPPAFLLASAVPWLEEQLEAGIGVPVELQSLTGVRLGILRQEATVSGLGLAESFDRPKAPFVHTGVATVRWNALAYFLGADTPIIVNLEQADIRLRLDKQGRFGFAPRKSGEPPGPWPHGPDVQLSWRDAQVTWQDDKTGVTQRLSLPAGKATLGDFRDLDWQIVGSLGPGSLSSAGQANLETGDGKAKIQLKKADVLPLLAYAPKMPVKPVKGTVEGTATASWRDWGNKDLKLQAAGSLDGGIKSEHWQGVATVTGKWRLNERRVAFDQLQARLGGQTLAASGTVAWKPKILYDLKAHGDDLAVDKLAAVLPSTMGQPLVGRADLVAVIRGDKPVIKGTITGRGLGYDKTKTGTSRSTFTVTADDLTLKGQATLGRGRIDHDVVVSWGKAVAMRLKADLHGVTLRELHPALAKADGAVSGTVTVTGSPKAPRIAARMRSDTLQFAKDLPGLVIADADVSGTTAAGTARILTRIAGGTGRILADWRGDALRARLHVDGVSAAAIRPWAPQLRRGSFELAATVSASRQALSGDWRQFQATGTLGARGAQWQTLPLVQGSLNGRWLAGRWQADSRWRAGPDRLALNATGWQPKQGKPVLKASWDGNVATVGRWLPDPQLWQGGKVDTTGTVRLAGTWSGTAKATVAQLVHERGALGSGRVALTLDDRLVRISEGHWRQGSEQIQLAGRVDLVSPSPKLGLQVRLEQADMARLHAGYRAFTAVRSVKNPVPAKLTVTDRLPRLDQRPDELNRLTLGQTIPERVPLLEVLEYWLPIARLYPPLQRVGETDAGKGVVPIDGRLTAYVTVEGTTASPRVRGSLAVADARLGDHRIPSVRAIGQWARSDWDLDSLTLVTANGGRLTGHGTVHNGQVAMEANGARLDLAPLQLATKPYGYVIDGAADLLLSVSGNISAPRALLGLTVNHGNLNGNPFDQLSLVADMADRRVDVTHFGFRQGNKQAVLTGSVPLNQNEPVSLYMRAEDESLGLLSLFTKHLEWLDGRGNFALHVRGTPAEPRLDGQLSLRKARLYLPSMGETLDSLSGNVKLSFREVEVNQPDGRTKKIVNEIQVKDLKGLYNGGQVGVDGTIELPWRTEPGFWGLRVTAKDIGIHRGGLYEGQASANLTIRNELSDPVISGKVTIDKGTSSLRRSASSNEVSTVGSQKAEPLPFRISNLRVQLGDAFWVKTPIFEMQPRGLVVVDWRNLADQPMIRGQVTSNKGHIQLASYRFNIQEAKADFIVREFDRDVSPINPRLNMVIAGSIPNPRSTARQMVPVEGHLTAFLENLETQDAFKLEWRNSAGLSDDEITKVVTGKTISEVASGNIDQVASDISPLLTQALFDPITDRIGQILQLDEINVGLGNSLSDPAFRVALNKPIWNGLSVGFGRVFSAQPVTTYSLNYRVFTNWSLRYEYEDPRDRTSLGTLSTQFNARF